MEEQKKDNHKPDEKKSCSTQTEHSYCKAIMAIAIIVIVWLEPSWGKIAITVLAALIIVKSCGCMCKGSKK